MTERLQNSRENSPIVTTLIPIFLVDFFEGQIAFSDIDYCASSVQVLLNAGFYEGMKVTKTKNAVKFIANIAGDGPTSVMIKVTANEIQELHTSMLALVPP